MTDEERMAQLVAMARVRMTDLLPKCFPDAPAKQRRLLREKESLLRIRKTT